MGWLAAGLGKNGFDTTFSFRFSLSLAISIVIWAGLEPGIFYLSILSI
jgi:hypothetical protein